jgi:hypothetical protein
MFRNYVMLEANLSSATVFELQEYNPKIQKQPNLKIIVILR